MSESRKIVMRFDAAGGVEIDAVCFQGSGCKEATKAYEQLFESGTNRKSSDKPEMFEDDADRESVTQRM